MPDRDDHEFDELPSMQAVRHDDATEEMDAIDEGVVQHTAKANTAKPKRNNANNTSVRPWATAVTAIVIAVIALVFSFYVSYKQSSDLADARERVAQLENRLSTTDESVTQSSVAIQVHLKELKDKTDELWTQMDKLWASAWRRNQSEIANHTKSIAASEKSIASLEKQLKSLSGSLSELKKTTAMFKSEIAVIKAETEEISNFSNSLAKQEQLIKSLGKDLQALQSTVSSVKQTAQDNASWLESINAFRQQTNQTLSRLEQQIKSLQPPAPVPASSTP